MRISSNQIGNYGPSFISDNRQSGDAKTAASNNQVWKSEMLQSMKSSNTESLSVQKAETSISNEEKSFFINMYPENQNEIADYHFYQKNGRMSGVAVGTLFDRRG